MSANSTYIPRRLDDQWKIGLWDMDIAVPWLVAFGIFYTALSGITGMIVGGAAGTFVGMYCMKSGSGGVRMTNSSSTPEPRRPF